MSLKGLSITLCEGLKKRKKKNVLKSPIGGEGAIFLIKTAIWTKSQGHFAETILSLCYGLVSLILIFQHTDNYFLLILVLSSNLLRR